MIYKKIIRPILFKTTDPEWIHHVALATLGRTPAASLIAMGSKPPSRPVKLWGLTFRNPFGLAAGFDKDGEAMYAWAKLGFGFAEVGTITYLPQKGNPKPRLFRCPKEMAAINRMGFPGNGVEVAKRTLEKYYKKPVPDFPIGINIGKSKDTPMEEAPEDYLKLLRELYDLGDFFVVNVSCPNISNFPDLQHPKRLSPILQALQKFNSEKSSKPILVKISPDLHFDDIAAILETSHENNIAGIVAVNTSLDHSAVTLDEKGGLSGRPLTKKSNDIIRFIKKHTDMPVIGAGGVFNRDDFQEKLDAGASLVQVYTGFVYEGPRIAFKVLS